MSSHSRVAPAKVNLFLHVMGKRADGYHLLESAVAFTEKGDEVTVISAEKLTLKIEGRFAEAIPVNDDNLVLKAANVLRQHFKIKVGATITLQKNLPVSSGIGGGSSDAATTAKLLCELWGIESSVQELGEILLPLGADIPACLHACPLLMTGIGETIFPLALEKEYGILLCNPLKPLATGEIFKVLLSYDLPLTDSITTLDVAFLNEKTHNALTAIAQKTVPEIAAILESLENREGCLLARMSGSGATCFGLFENEREALQAEQEIKKEWPDYWMLATRLKRA